MRLSWRASTSALFRLSSSSTSFRRRPFSPLAAAVSPPSHQLCSQRRIRTPAPFPRRMASAAATSADATGPSKDHDRDDAALKSWDERDPVRFATHPIPRSTIFAVSRRSFAFVNLRPVVPGHVLISPKRVAPRFADLTTEEVSDLWLLAQKVGRVAERKQQLEREEREGKASSSAPSSSASASPSSALTFALQDGASAGQSVPHVHVHVIPRGGPGDRFHGEEKNDELYPELQRAGAALSRELAAREEKEEAAAASAAAASAASAASAATAAVPAPDPFQRERKDRTLQEMEEEAAALRELFSRS